MFSLARQAFARRAFSTSTVRNDMAKVVLIGRVGKTPELRTNRNGKEYVSYSVATSNNLPDGTSRTTWHNISSFNSQAQQYLLSVPKGSLVYVEGHFEIREPDLGADPTSPQAQRSIFYRHDYLRLLRRGSSGESDPESNNMDNAI